MLLSILMLVPLISKLIKFSSLSNVLQLCSDHFLIRFCQTGGIIMDPAVWLDEARPPPPKYVYKSIMSVMKTKI
jgi:hypothetical protein